MDGIKLTKWRHDFYARVMHIEKEHTDLIKGENIKNIVLLDLDTSNEWKIRYLVALPDYVVNEFQRALLDTKPEDSV